MKSKAMLITMTVVSLVVLGTGVAMAQRTCFSMLDRIPGIELTEAQKASLDKSEVQHQKTMIQLKSELDIARLEKQALMKKKDFNKGDVSKAIETMNAIQKKIQMARLDALDDVRKVLTDEQWSLFSDTMGKRGGGHHGKKACMGGNRMGKGGHHGYGGTGDKGRFGTDCPYYKERASEE